jgi:hypothetical protein
MKNQDLGSFYTYYKNRKCLFCGNPIADQIHGLRKHCPRIILPDGTVGSCKDDKHIARRKTQDLPYNRLARHHKLMNERIADLMKTTGETVTLEDINRFGIILHRPVEIRKNKDGKYSYCFVEYTINESFNNQFKIKKHERLF